MKIKSNPATIVFLTVIYPKHHEGTQPLCQWYDAKGHFLYIGIEEALEDLKNDEPRRLTNMENYSK